MQATGKDQFVNEINMETREPPLTQEGDLTGGIYLSDGFIIIPSHPHASHTTHQNSPVLRGNAQRSVGKGVNGLATRQNKKTAFSIPAADQHL